LRLFGFFPSVNPPLEEFTGDSFTLLFEWTSRAARRFRAGKDGYFYSQVLEGEHGLLMAIDPSLCHYVMLMEETHGTFLVFFSLLQGLASFTFTNKTQFNYCIYSLC
jgi:hypothetical protein